MEINILPQQIFAKSKGGEGGLIFNGGVILSEYSEYFSLSMIFYGT